MKIYLEELGGVEEVEVIDGFTYWKYSLIGDPKIGIKSILAKFPYVIDIKGLKFYIRDNKTLNIDSLYNSLDSNCKNLWDIRLKGKNVNLDAVKILTSFKIFKGYRYILINI